MLFTSSSTLVVCHSLLNKLPSTSPLAVNTLVNSRGGDYRGDGGTRPPPNILVGGDAKVNVPPLIAHLVKTLLWLTPKCLLKWRIKGFCIIKIQFLFSFRKLLLLLKSYTKYTNRPTRWKTAPLTPDQGLCPWTPLGALPPTLPPFRRNRHHWWTAMYPVICPNYNTTSYYEKQSVNDE